MRSLASSMQQLSAEAGALVRQALEFHSRGNWERAEPLYRQALEIDPAQPHVLHLAGVLENQLGRPAAALELIRQAIGQMPEQAEFHNSLGNAFRAQGDLPAAAASFERGLSINPRSPEILT